MALYHLPIFVPAKPCIGLLAGILSAYADARYRSYTRLNLRENGTRQRTLSWLFV